jgi:succinate dehydrogenase / fumarate reductase flavoprotein subunit/fumarate reductase flavoprotein subunit
VYIDASHLGAEFVLAKFPGMAERCQQFNYDLARGKVPVAPSAHFFMGGAVIDTGGKASLEKLFVAGEDAGGVHGANRLGGNGICDSCVYGRQAGKAMGKYLTGSNLALGKTRAGLVEETIDLLSGSLGRDKGPSPFEVRKELQELNWNKVGVARTGQELGEALAGIEVLGEEVSRLRVTGGPAYNMVYTAAVDLRSMIDVSRMVATSALAREETRGAHFRQDHPTQRDDYGLFNIFMRRGTDGLPVLDKRPVAFTHKSVEECQKYRK